MPTRGTPTTGVRLGADLLDAARRVLGLPPDTPGSEVVRAALEKLTGTPPGSTRRNGRPPKTSRADRPNDDELTRT